MCWQAQYADHFAEEGIALIRNLYAIEAEIRGSDPAVRLAIRQECSVPILACRDNWLGQHRSRASAKSPLGEALAHIAKYRDDLGRFLHDGRVEIDSNNVENLIRLIANGESLYPSSSSIWKHLHLVFLNAPTRAAFPPEGFEKALIHEI